MNLVFKTANAWLKLLKTLSFLILVVVLGVTAFSVGKKFGASSVKPLPPGPPPEMHFVSDLVSDPYPDLGRLLSMTPNQLQAMDIAVLNLDCAKGLPGTENLDIPAACKQLDDWAEHVRSETERAFHKFKEAPEFFSHSESYFRALLMVTVVEQDMGVHYNMARVTDGDYTHINDVMISGLLGSDRSGTCASLPVLYVAIGRRLGYPMKLVSAGGHLFSRWESPDGKVRFNMEAMGHGLACHADKFFMEWPYKLADEEIKSGIFLRSMSGVEEFATFLSIKANVLEALGRLPESQLSMAEAHALIPPHDMYLGSLAVELMKEKLLLAGQLDLNLPGNRFKNAKEPDYELLPADGATEKPVIHDEGSGQ